MVEYDFKAISVDEYENKIILSVDNRTLMKVLASSLKKLRKNVPKEQYEMIEQFEIDDRFKNVLRTALLSNLKKINAEVLKDGIRVINMETKKGIFKRNGESWDIVLTFGGMYAKV